MKRKRFSLGAFSTLAVLASVIMLSGCELDVASLASGRLDPCDLLVRNDVLFLGDMSLFSSGCEGIDLEHIEEIGGHEEEEEEESGGHVH